MLEISDYSIDLLQEYARRQSHAINAYKPSEQENHNQLSYHKATSRYRLLFGGNQSGKSHAAAYDCACNARGKNPFTDIHIKGRDVEIWVISTEYLTIKNGIYRHLENILPDWEILKEGAKIVGTNLPSFIEVKRPDGYKTTITFMSAKSDDMRQKFQAAAVDYFYIDEEITETIWEELEFRTLATGGKFSISATLVESYEWITRLEDLAIKGDKNVFLTRLNTELNPYLDQSVVQFLKHKYSDEALAYRFYGKARRLTGLIYNNWTPAHVVPAFKIPHDWPRWCAIDPGIRTCAALWIAVGPDDHAYAYRELYAHNEPLWQVALEIKKCEGYTFNRDLSYKFNHYVFEETEDSEKLILRLIDPKSRARSEAGETSILDQLYERYGLLCTPADNSLRAGLEDCRFWLQNLEDKIPGFRVFDTLTNFQDERRVYRPRPETKKRDQNSPIEDPIRKHNHLMDCWRYIARQKPKYADRVLLSDRSPYISPHETLKQKKDITKQGIMVDILGECW